MKYIRYVEGSSARKIEYDVQLKNKVIRKKIIKKSFVKAKRKAVASVILMFLMLFMVMARYAYITQLNYTINGLEKDYTSYVKDNNNISTEIDKMTSLSNIRTQAEEKLGMKNPEGYQIVYVNTEKNDYTVISEDYINRSSNINNGVFTALLDKFSTISAIFK